jgi:hypothetical protein
MRDEICMNRGEVLPFLFDKAKFSIETAKEVLKEDVDDVNDLPITFDDKFTRFEYIPITDKDTIWKYSNIVDGGEYFILVDLVK